jgi:SAM-dependent methyltransferase
MRELSKSIPRRQRDPNFITKYFVGNGIDIGGFPDPLSLYSEMFPLIQNIRIWDWDDGDAQHLSGVENESIDFIVSSHCLEHLIDPTEGLANWIRVIKPGGYGIITIPDEDLYEQQVWPSNKNLDHKHTFTIYKSESWSPNSKNVLDLLISFADLIEIRKIEVLDSSFRYQMPKYDQTSTPIGESAIEIVFRKKTSDEIIRKTNRIITGEQPPRETLKYFNQYTSDYRNLKLLNSRDIPFSDGSPL